jgi:hypothetical protein
MAAGRRCQLQPPRSPAYRRAIPVPSASTGTPRLEGKHLRCCKRCK